MITKTKIVTALLFLTAFFNNLLGQNNFQDSTRDVLVIKNKWGSVRPNAIKENKRIKIWLVDETKVSGKFLIVSDSLIEIDGDTIPILDIEKIRASTKKMKGAGIIAAFVGGYLTITAINLLMADPNGFLSFHDFGYILLPPGSLLLVSGGYLIYNGRRFSTDKGWEFCVE